jgi:hypothetical protein
VRKRGTSDTSLEIDVIRRRVSRNRVESIYHSKFEPSDIGVEESYLVTTTVTFSGKYAGKKVTSSYN